MSPPREILSNTDLPFFFNISFFRREGAKVVDCPAVAYSKTYQHYFIPNELPPLARSIVE